MKINKTLVLYPNNLIFNYSEELFFFFFFKVNILKKFISAAIS